MKNLKGLEIKRLFEKEFGVIPCREKTLYILLGVLGDFDSFEFMQLLLANLKGFKKLGLDFYVIGIGDSRSKEYFCKYTKLPNEFLRVVENNLIHNKLDLDNGLTLPISPLLNIILMCMGIHSEGTLKEVLRGYTGDRSGPQLFSNNDKISFFNRISFGAELFNILGDKGFLRPFELASLRLMNMTEVISYWNIYMKYNLFLTQRSGTFLLDSSQKLLYSYRSKALLDFAENMSNPMEFLYNSE